MTCPSCKAELRDTAKFCPHCGAESFRPPSTFAESLAPAHEDQDAVATRMAAAYGSKIPKKYSDRLERGSPAEAIIEELIRRYDSLRGLVEKAVEKLAEGKPDRVADGLTMYLRGHCEVCGQRLAPAAIGHVSRCEGCDTSRVAAAS